MIPQTPSNNPECRPTRVSGQSLLRVHCAHISRLALELTDLVLEETLVPLGGSLLRGGQGTARSEHASHWPLIAPIHQAEPQQLLGLAQEGHFLRDLPLSEAEPGIPRGTCPAPGPSRISFHRFL